MSIKKLTAGSGYDYLTRQVAAMDATEKGHTGLATYYTEKGETPGVWVGSGMDGIDGLSAGDTVTADHMQSLFGAGLHPLAAARAKQLGLRIGRPHVDTPTEADYKDATRLGVPFKVYEDDVPAFRIEVAKRIAEINAAAGMPADWPVTSEERAQVRTDVARDFFRAEHGREAADARELTATIAKHSRPKTTAVAGFDLTFSPVKSVSTLWAVADQTTAAQIERAHQEAITDALDFVEREALFTRLGTNGVRQVDVRGLVATAFTHRDSRAGDPDLHTHIAVANKVQTLDGKWRAIDGRILYKATVAASEVYNTALERHLGARLGVRFAERDNPDPKKRPIREIIGVDARLNEQFSKRRLSIEERRNQLVTAFQHTHGRPPSPIETVRLAQQATLETRDAKHEPRTLAEQRTAWNREATAVLGSDKQVDRMVREALHPTRRNEVRADRAWVASTAASITQTLQSSRATWQYWHVYAEAQRRVRAAKVPAGIAETTINRLVSTVLGEHSVGLVRPVDTITEPDELRRADGTSVYTVAGADLYTSPDVLAAEQRLVAAAGHTGGFGVDENAVGLALLESEANGLKLNAGQATLVREMATSGTRLQLAIAPAGSGKTTAMEGLARAWSAGGGTIIGLAPQAGAAKVLGERIDSVADTLAKFVNAIDNETAAAPDWMTSINDKALVVIDEAGMADTFSLDAAVSYVLDRGGSVRLIGDDQQLAAIAAGGVLRDIKTTHGALHLSELVRFQNPSEAAASLALRDGKPEALGFYLDHDRVHVGDLATMTEDVFTAWQADRAKGLDPMMLAPTHDLVSELNQRAQAARLDGAPEPDAGAGPVQQVQLADGNQASIGDVVLTRNNDRRLRVSATDWVKNGDRWSVVDARTDGALVAKNLQHGRLATLPADYVRAYTRLGYAATIHSAQGLTADTLHGLATGGETRNLLYTLLSRGAYANHIYLGVVGDGDPHSVIHPDVTHPPTPTDILEQALARDGTQQSATSQLREHTDVATRLGEATNRYVDSLYVAAETFLGPEVADALETAAEEVVPGVTDDAAWPTLRAHLLLFGAHGDDPVAALRAAADQHELGTAADRAAVLDWRLDPSGLRNADVGPLPWLPSIPSGLADDPHWGGYLRERADLVEDLADQVHDRALQTADTSPPEWAHNGLRPDKGIVADVEVWRAAMQVPGTDQRPTGRPQLQKATTKWQRRLNHRVAGTHRPAVLEWGHLLKTVAPQIRSDEFTGQLATRLAVMARSGLDATTLLTDAAAQGPLPDDHAAAALWWRISRHVSPAIAEQIDSHGGDHIATEWTTRLPEILGRERAQRVQASPSWPSLVANIDQGIQRGWQLTELLSPGADAAYDDLDEAQTLVWRTSIALETIPDDEPYDYHLDEPPEDLWDGVDPADRPTDDLVETSPVPNDHVADASDHRPKDSLAPVPVDGDRQPVEDLTLAAIRRDLAASMPLEPTDADINRMLDRAHQWDDCPISEARMLQINTLTQQFFEDRFADSWGRSYLADRFGIDLADHEQIRPGQAPAGWTNLVDHLRRNDVADDEMIAAGVAKTARTGRLIDTFRDRVTFPITRPGRGDDVDILGFVARRHPDHNDKKDGPKYLNTAETPLFHKAAQLFGDLDALADPASIPVIVEGPTDAIAVTLASAGRYIGVAPLGTSLTVDQATWLGELGRDPVIARDGDLAGQIAAERDFWRLTPHGLDPASAQLPADDDPCDLLTNRGPAALVAAIDNQHPLGDELVGERLAHLGPETALPASIKVIAARPSAAWPAAVDGVSDRLDASEHKTLTQLDAAIKTWDGSPVTAAQTELDNIAAVHKRRQRATEKSPAERWAPLAAQLDPRLLTQPDWPATARMLQEAHEHGHDVAGAACALLDEAPLNDQPAQDLRYRVVSRLDMTVASSETITHAKSVPTTHDEQERAPRRSPNQTPSGPRR